MKRAITTLALVLAAAGCPKGDGDAAGKDKDAYVKAIADVKEPVGVIAAFVPHLKTEPRTGKYAPQGTTDIDRGATFAGNGIRSAANRARLKLQGEGTKVGEQLAEPFVAVSKTCADVQGAEAVAKCKAAVDALDAALQQASAKASAAGATESFPRIADASITEGGKKEVAPLVTAMGGGKEETSFLAKLEDPAATANDVVSSCQAADDEATARMKELEKIDEEARKVAATHGQVIKAVCARLGRADTARADLEACIAERDKKKKLSKEREEECKAACAGGKAVIDQGIPAATFTKIEGLFKDFCEKEKK